MKFILLFINLSFTHLSYAQTDRFIKPNEIATKLKNSNLEIYAGATQVYNSKQRIKLARSSLLPKLNIWRLSSVLIDWKSAGEVLSQDLVPFLIPANWQRVKEMKQFSAATNEGFHGLQKNIIFQSKIMYFQLQQEFYHYEMQKNFLTTLNNTIYKIQGQIHLNPQINQWFLDLNYKKTLIELDLLQIERLLWEERQMLSIAIGLDTSEILLPEFLNDLIVDSVEENSRNNQDVENVLSHSCEIKEYDLLIKVAPKVKREFQWSILGISDISRGAEGGVFDEIPLQDGLGFGINSSIKVHKKQVELLKRQRAGVAQILLRQIQSINYSLKNLEEEKKVAREKMNILEKEKNQLELQFSLGGKFNPLQLLEVEQKMVLAKISYGNLFLRIKIEDEKLKRIFEEEDYQIEAN